MSLFDTLKERAMSAIENSGLDAIEKGEDWLNRQSDKALGPAPAPAAQALPPPAQIAAFAKANVFYIGMAILGTLVLVLLLRKGK